jgi:transglutaminase/protease-like cytokinesis protein 3
MVSEEVVEGVMRSALNSISKKDNISLKDLRIKMELNDSKNSVECSILEGTEYKNDLSWSRILGMKVVFSNIIIDTIKKSLMRISREKNIEADDINARIYAIDNNGTPNIYIYNAKKPLRKIELSEIL